MSFVLVHKTTHVETYRIRCDRCGEETATVTVDRADIQPEKYRHGFIAKASYVLRKLAKDADYTRVKDKHLCQVCEAERKPEHQLGLIPVAPKRPQAWRQA